MEFSWSALWNITDETPDNCQMFLNCRGMSLFLECLQVSHTSETVSIYLAFSVISMLVAILDEISHVGPFLAWFFHCVLKDPYHIILPQEFPDKQELHMLGLLGNVAEVKALRPQLLTPQFITVFR